MKPDYNEHKLIDQYGFKEEYEEERKGNWMYTGYPKPLKRYRIIFESFNQSIEEPYFWLINVMRDGGIEIFDKITDIFTASEQSSMFGSAQQRKGVQQDKVSQYLAAIGKMTKEMFQVVRELRIIDQRMDLYEQSFEENKKKAHAAEITLKGIWIDLVEQGAKNPASVYGMARDLGFATLPDLFFAAMPMKESEIDDYVSDLEFNRKVKEVLKRKLKTYCIWKKHTYKEIKTRKNFTIKYLRQHYDVIKMYMSWVKPYLKNIRRLGLNTSGNETVDIISAFEGSLIEIEFIGRAKIADFIAPKQEGERTEKKVYYAVNLLNLKYRTRPSMNYHAEGYQRGPIHVGALELTYRAYAWTSDEIKNYKKMKEAEDLELLSDISTSIKDAMDALGDDVQKYLEEAGEKFPEKDKPPKKTNKKYKLSDSMPLFAVFEGFFELFGSLIPKSSNKTTNISKQDIFNKEKLEKGAKKQAIGMMWPIYKNFKKAHGMMAW